MHSFPSYLCFVSIFLFAPYLNLPEILYVSPLRFAPVSSFFDVALYELDGVTGALRWRLFTPWGPALGLLGSLYFWICLLEKDSKFRFYGLCGCILMILMSKSRAAQGSILLVLIIYCLVGFLRRPVSLFILSACSYASAISFSAIVDFFNNLWYSIASARAASTRVRMELAKIAFAGWREEAFIWGHGIVIEGPKLVEGMPIGSHHTWLGLLFVKGIVGFIAFLIPFLATLIFFLYKSIRSPAIEYRTGLAIILTLLIYTFSENLEILIYLYWPAFVALGACISANVRQKAARPI